MRKLLVSLFLITGFISASAAGPSGKDLGFGIMLGDPLGGTLKYWSSGSNAFNFSVGSSYFGSPRVGADYLWHYEPFHFEQFKLYAGPGIVLGIGSKDEKDKSDKFYDLKESEAGIALRGIIGLAVIPKTIPFELFIEMGPLVGVAPEVGSAFDFGIGFRFYP